MRVKTKRRKIKMSKASTIGECGFNERDIVAAQNGDTEAWNKIHKHFMPYIRIIVYRHHPGYTAQDYNDRKKAAEAALLEAVMNFKFHD